MNFYRWELHAAELMCGQGSNSRPPGSDTKLDGPPLPVQPYNPGDIEEAKGLFIMFQHAQMTIRGYYTSSK
jgi:hypothetical protein